MASRCPAKLRAVVLSLVVVFGCVSNAGEDGPLEGDTEALATDKTCCSAGWSRVLAPSGSPFNKNHDSYICQKPGGGGGNSPPVISADNNSPCRGSTTEQADLTITKTDGVTTYTPGAPRTYTIIVSNDGPSAVAGARVVDTLPTQVSSAAWTCVASAGASCPANGNGNINRTVDLPAGGTATFTVVAQTSASASGGLTNTATVTAPAGVTDPNPANNTATDSDTATSIADLSITKTDSHTTAVPGTPTTYTIIVSNDGPGDAVGATVVDTLVGLTGATWTCAGSGGGTCTANDGTGDIDTTVNLPVHGSATFTLTAQVEQGLTGSLTNTATVGPPTGVTDPSPANNSATDTDTVTPVADLAITKTDGVTTYTPGGMTTYTIIVTNNGPSDVLGPTGAVVADLLPPTLTGTWTCVPLAGSTCGALTGSGNIDTTVSLAAHGSATFIVTANISSTATGDLKNTATVTPPVGVTDPSPSNNTDTDTDTLAQ